MRYPLRLLAIAATIGAMAAVPAAGTAAARRHSPARMNIVQLAASNRQFSTLVSLVKKAGLVKALEGRGPLTLFAPTNSAFAALAHKDPKLFAKVSHSKKLLAEVLEHHVVAGRLPASQVIKHRSLKTLLGQTVSVRVRGMRVYVNQARVVKANILASNGVVHAINAVLLPTLG